MGFWSTMGDLAGSAVKATADFSRKIKEKKLEMENYSDEQLVRAFKRGDMAERTAANAIYQNRHGKGIGEAVRNS